MFFVRQSCRSPFKVSRKSKHLKKIASYPNTYIFHDINATLPLEPQLTNILKHSTGKPDTMLSYTSSLFDFIIFNFPHLGVEDSIQHSSLLAHFFYSVRPLMHSKSIIHLSLTRGQSERWRLTEMAERVGMDVIGCSPLIEAAWPGYEWKRHQGGQSFRSRVIGDEGVTFRLHCKSSIDPCVPHVASGLFEKIYAKIPM